MGFTSVGDYDIDTQRILGVGGFGKVYLGLHKTTKQKVAIKMMSRAFIKKHNLAEYVNAEASILRTIRHPHVVELYNVVEERDAIYFITEFASHGELFDRIVTCKYFSEDVARKYFQQMISAVHACHNRDICHRDLKAENLLLNENDELKVCDFGLSKVIDIEKEHSVLLHSIAGSLDYQCPEMLLGKQEGYCGRRADLWAAAVILAFMLGGNLPFTALTEDEVQRNIIAGRYVLPSHISPTARAFLDNCFRLDPTQRLTMQQILQHPWFLTDIDPELFPEGLETAVYDAAESPIQQPCPFKSFQRSNSFTGTMNSELLLSVHRAFDSMDVSHVGVIPIVAVRDALILLNKGKPISQKVLDDVTKYLDPTNTKVITRSAFANAMCSKQLPQHNPLKLASFTLENLDGIFHFHGDVEYLAELRRAFTRLDKQNTGVLSPEDHPNLRHLCFFGSAGQTPCTFDSFAVHWENCCRHKKECRHMEVFEGLISYDQAATLHSRGGFTVRGQQEDIQKAIMTKLGGSDYVVTTPGPGVLHAMKKKLESDKVEMNASVVLQKTIDGYTKVDAVRLRGSTTHYHDMVRNLMVILENERTQAEKDTEAVGEPEEV
eukprot:PhF_6_TR40170/c5_g1_i2/m.59526/K07198/PRKAA, AMPK; 5'-AMP-activated protein kinase, catalytic alpha subunit